MKLERKQQSKKTILQVKDRTEAFLNEFGNTMPRELAGERFVSWFWEKKRELNWSERARAFEVSTQLAYRRIKPLIDAQKLVLLDNKAGIGRPSDE